MPGLEELERAELELRGLHPNGQLLLGDQELTIGAILYLDSNLAITIRCAIRDHNQDFLSILFNCRSTFIQILRQEREEMANYDTAADNAEEQLEAIIESRQIWNSYFPTIDRYLRISDGLEVVDENDLPQLREPLPEHLPQTTVSELVTIMRKFIATGIKEAINNDFAKAIYLFTCARQCSLGVIGNLRVSGFEQLAGFYLNLIQLQQQSAKDRYFKLALWHAVKQQFQVLNTYDQLIADMKQYFAEHDFFGNYLSSSCDANLRNTPYYNEIYSADGKFSDFEILRINSMVPTLFRYSVLSGNEGMYYQQENSDESDASRQFHTKVANLNGETSRAHQEVCEVLISQRLGQPPHALNFENINAADDLALFTYVFDRVAAVLASGFLWQNFNPNLYGELDDLETRFSDCANQLLSLNGFMESLQQHNHIPPIAALQRNYARCCELTKETKSLITSLQNISPLVQYEPFGCQIDNEDKLGKVVADHYINIGKELIEIADDYRRDVLLQQLKGSKTPQALAVLFVLQQVNLLAKRDSSRDYLAMVLKYERAEMFFVYIVGSFAEYMLPLDVDVADKLSASLKRSETIAEKVISALVRQRYNAAAVIGKLPLFNDILPGIVAATDLEPNTMSDNGYGVFTPTYMQYRDQEFMQQIHRYVAGLLINDSEYKPQHVLASIISRICSQERVAVDVNNNIPQVSVDVVDEMCWLSVSMCFKRSDFRVVQYLRELDDNAQPDQPGKRKVALTNRERFADLLLNEAKSQLAEDVVLRANITLSVTMSGNGLVVTNELFNITPYVTSLAGVFNDDAMARFVSSRLQPEYSAAERVLWTNAIEAKVAAVRDAQDWFDIRVLVLGNAYSRYVDQNYHLFDAVRDEVESRRSYQVVLDYLFNIKLNALQNNHCDVQRVFIKLCQHLSYLSSKFNRPSKNICSWEAINAQLCIG